MIDFATTPERYRHWRIEVDGDLATLTMDVDEQGGLFEGYELKLNSYDLGVDIELYDAVQRLRFEHPGVKTVIMKSGKDKVFCAGANIRMLGASSHAHKVNFCKFTNETRNSMEDASEASGQKYLCAVTGSCAGGGYELALAADYIMLIDDRSSTVALPETPLLAVLPGTGGLTRVTDKRKVRRDLADVFCSIEEGVKGQKAVDWRLVDEVVPKSKWDARVTEAARELASQSNRPDRAEGVSLTPLERAIDGDRVTYPFVRLEIDRSKGLAEIIVSTPDGPPPADAAAALNEGVSFWPMALARALDDAILHLRTNENEIGIWVFKSEGDSGVVLAYDALLERAKDDWFVNEVRHYLKRVFKRLDVTSRSMIAQIEPGSCFAGTLAELLFAADRSVMLEGVYEGSNLAPATITLSALNFDAYPMGNGLSRLATRFWGDDDLLDQARVSVGTALDAEEARDQGLVTFAFDEIDMEDEVRLMLEERTNFSPDALTGMEANLRFAGPETMETKIFGRLTAWQNWIFQRPNAVGEEGALKRYGTGLQPQYNRGRV
ncbi:MAG: 2,3-epoxybenzoyl-CoA dihydrolase [Pseudomonadota bacterium]